MATVDDDERARNITEMMETCAKVYIDSPTTPCVTPAPATMTEPAATFKHPQCLLRPPSSGSFLPQMLDVDFTVLSKRSGSTSTPFVPRTASTASVTPITPYFSDGSLYDSAIDSSSHHQLFSPMCHSAKRTASSKVLSRPRFSSIAESDTDVESPKAVLFPISESDTTEQCSTLESPVTSPKSDQCVPLLPKVFYGEHQKLPKHLQKDIQHPPSKHSQDSSSSDLDNSCPDTSSPSFDSQNSLFTFSGHSQSSTDTGYESQLGFELSSSLEHSISPPLSESVAMCVSHFAPKNLDRLIGRKVGLDQVDIISQLSVRNLRIPLKMILSQLSRKDLKSMSSVNDHWRSIVDTNSDLFKRRTSPRIKKMAQQKENYAQKKRSESRSLTTPRGTLSMVQATAPETPTFDLSTPVMTSQARQALDLSQKYWREAEQLKNEECLRKCPRCCCPAKMNPTQERAWCSNESCEFDFCVKCHRAFHGSKDCSMTVAAKKPKSEIKVCSKRSKKNLRRL